MIATTTLAACSGPSPAPGPTAPTSAASTDTTPTYSAPSPTVADDRIGWPSTLQPWAERFTTLAEREAASRGLTRIPYSTGGNFVTTTWCPPAQLERCGLGFTAEPGSWIELQGAGYDALAPSTLVLRTSYAPTDREAWEASAAVGLGSATDVARPGVGFTLTRSAARPSISDTDPEAARIPTSPDVFTLSDALSYSYSFAVGTTSFTQGSARAIGEVEVTATASPLAQLRGWTGSDASMTARARSTLAALRTKALAGLSDGTAMACTVGPSRGSIPPDCPQRAMTAAERATATRQLQAWYANRLALLSAEHSAMYAAVRQSFDWSAVTG